MLETLRCTMTSGTTESAAERIVRETHEFLDAIDAPGYHTDHPRQRIGMVFISQSEFILKDIEDVKRAMDP